MADTDINAAPASVNMPDHAMRKHWLYQAFDRLWRPANGWIACPVALFYAAVWGPAHGQPLPEGYLVALLGYSAAIYGVKSWEKVKGVA